MSREAQEYDRLRTQLRTMLKRVPASINAGGVQAVRDFKKFHEASTKAISSERTSLAQLQSIYNQSQRFYTA